MPHNLTTTWLSYRVKIGTRADALRWLNSKAHTAYTSSRLNEWLRGDREPDRATRIVMLRDCLPNVLPNHSPKQYDLLSESLT